MDEERFFLSSQQGVEVVAPAEGLRELLDQLLGIEETLLLYQGERGRPSARRMLTEMDATQRRLYDLFGLKAYAPKR